MTANNDLKLHCSFSISDFSEIFSDFTDDRVIFVQASNESIKNVS